MNKSPFGHIDCNLDPPLTDTQVELLRKFLSMAHFDIKDKKGLKRIIDDAYVLAIADGDIYPLK